MLTLALLALAADPVPLAFHPANVFDAIPSSMLMNVTHMTTERPEGITAEPAYINAPWYAAIRFGDSGTLVHFALDEDDERAVLFIDANANGDLTDDPFIDARREVIPEEDRTPILKVWIFDFFEATIPVAYHDGSTLDLAITFRTYGKVCRDMNANMPPDLVSWSTYYRAGEAAFGDATFPVAVKDQNADGRFDTLKDEDHSWGDRLYIDLDRDGLFQPRGEGYAIDAPFEVDGVVYEVKRITPSGDSIEVGTSEREFTPTMLRVGEMAPDFDIPGDSPGVGSGFGPGVRRLSDLRGQVVLIDFWATWCVPCLAEMPHVIAAEERFRDQGFRVVGVSIDRAEDGERMHEVAEEKGMTWPEVHDADQVIARRYYVTSVPATFLIGPDGRILASYVRGEELEAAVERSLGEGDETGGKRDPGQSGQGGN